MSDVTEQSLLIVGGQPARGRGRPRVQEPRSSVSTWIPISQHDRLVQLAIQQEKSVSTLISEILLKELVG